MAGVFDGSRGRGENGQALVETALAFPILLIVALVLVQFALFYQAEGVMTGAVQDGARVAAAEDGSLADGVVHTQDLLQAGLGRSAGQVAVQGSDGGSTVTVQAHGHLQLIVPWIGGTSLPLQARSTISKERFRVGPGG
jgi:Flp pilus assembly protein TadG